MINIGNVTVLSMNCGHTTNTPGTIVTTPTQLDATNTFLKASIGNKTDYYPTFHIFLYLQNNLHVLIRFDAKRFHILYFFCPVALLICFHVFPSL